MDENSKINLTIENYTGEKPIVIVYREGVAGKVLDEKAPVSTDVAGVLSTPQDWLEKRVATIDQKKAKILVEREKYTITLIVNESDPYNKATISGTAELSEVFKKFGINDPNAGWVPPPAYRPPVASNLPKSFTVKIPIFKGPEKTTFDVEFDHYLTDGEVFLQLVSPGAKEISDEWRDTAIDRVLNEIRGIAPDIAILEA